MTVRRIVPQIQIKRMLKKIIKKIVKTRHQMSQKLRKKTRTIFLTANMRKKTNVLRMQELI